MSMRFGLIYEDVVVDVVTLAAGQTIDDVVTEDRASEYISIPDSVDVGDIKGPNNTWAKPTVTA